ncbi:Golgi transport complex subunit 3 [Savitreella phatthalungensis]
MDDYLYDFSSAVPSSRAETPALDGSRLAAEKTGEPAAVLTAERADPPTPDKARPRAASFPRDFRTVRPALQVSVAWLNYCGPTTVDDAMDENGDQLHEDADDSGGHQDAIADLVLLELRQRHIVELEECRRVLRKASTVLETLESVRIAFDEVGRQTSSLQKQCEGLTREEKEISQTADAIRDHLKNFAHLVAAERLLNAPGSAVVTKPEFTRLVDQLHSSIAFLDTHGDYRDAEVYRARYAQNLTKALSLSKVFFVETLRAAAAEVTSMKASGRLNANTQSALLYTKFRSLVPQLQETIDAIRMACGKNSDYEGLLEDCLSAYFGTRRTLVQPFVHSTVKEISTIEDLAPLGAAVISFIRLTATDEYDLFEAFFSPGDSQQHTAQISRREYERFLTWLTQPMIDILRPRLIAEALIAPLCELVGALQSQCRREVPEADGTGKKQIDLAPILQSLLNDARMRLARRARDVVKTDVMTYQPSDAELNYPDIILSVPPLGNATMDSQGLDSQLMPHHWYPSLRLGLSLLSKVHRLMPTTSFGRLLHETVRAVMTSLTQAALLMRRRKHVNTADADLFLLRHLLLLKEQIDAMELEDCADETGMDIAGEPEHDVNGSVWWDARTEIASGFFSLASRLVGSGAQEPNASANRQHAGRTPPHASYKPQLSYRHASSPAVVGSRTGKIEEKDALEELDNSMRACIGALSSRVSDDIAAALRKPLTSAADALAAHADYRSHFEVIWERFASRAASFFAKDDQRIARALSRVVKDRVLGEYEKFLNASGATDLPSVLNESDWITRVTGVAEYSDDDEQDEEEDIGEDENRSQ